MSFLSSFFSFFSGFFFDGSWEMSLADFGLLSACSSALVSGMAIRQHKQHRMQHKMPHAQRGIQNPEEQAAWKPELPTDESIIESPAINASNEFDDSDEKPERPEEIFKGVTVDDGSAVVA